MKFSDVEVGQKFSFLSENGNRNSSTYIKINIVYDYDDIYSNCVNITYFNLAIADDNDNVEFIEEPEKKTYFAIRDQYGNYAVQHRDDCVVYDKECAPILKQTREKAESVISRELGYWKWEKKCKQKEIGYVITERDKINFSRILEVVVVDCSFRV